MTCDLAEFEDQEQVDSSKYDTIRTAFGQEKHHEGLVEWYNLWLMVVTSYIISMMSVVASTVTRS